ncbi:MAG: hypothetical protein JF590_08500, partial [Gemmatimonadetes bacterium]|nr:hypothetical protein [Gemmatimonadota bacterium]
MLSETQRSAIQDTWQMVVPIADAAAKRFYEILLEAQPELRPMFARSDMAEQRKKLVAALNLVVRSLDSLESILPALQSLGSKHVRYGVEERHYVMVAAALLETFEEGLGAQFTDTA